MAQIRMNFHDNAEMLHDQERPKGESKTIPDQAMSLGEIIRRYASGLPITGVRQPIYEGETPGMPDFSKMDLADVQEYRDEMERWLLEEKRNLKKKQEEKEAKFKQLELFFIEKSKEIEDKKRKESENKDQLE